MDNSVTLSDVTIISVIFAVVACLVTSVRLIERTRTKLLWWDDFCALCSMMGLVSLIVATEEHYSSAAALYGSTVGVATYYTQALSFYVTVWMSRTAILFTIIRIIPTRLEKHILYGVAAAFGLVLCVLFAQEFWICETSPAWKEATPPPQCPLGLQSAIFQLSSDVVSDLIIVIVPLRLLKRARISLHHRIRLMAIFATSIATTLVSIVHVSYLVMGIKMAVIFTAIIEAGVSLIVCNLTVIVSIVFRTLSRLEPESNELDATAPITAGPVFEINPISRSADFYSIDTGVLPSMEDEQDSKAPALSFIASASSPDLPQNKQPQD